MYSHYCEIGLGELLINLNYYPHFFTLKYIYIYIYMMSNLRGFATSSIKAPLKFIIFVKIICAIYLVVISIFRNIFFISSNILIFKACD